MSPWSTSNRRASLPPDWHKQRARTWRAANGQCQWHTDGQRCTWTGRLNGDRGQCDHVNGPNSPELQWLCPDHHKTKTQTEAAAAHLHRRRPTPRHPGLM